MTENNKRPGAEPVLVERVSDNIALWSDGKYRWTYELNLLKNPAIFLLVYKIFFFIFLGGFAVMMIADLLNGVGDTSFRIANDLRFAGYFLIGMTIVCLLGYLLYAAIMGGKYVVEFEMDEKGVEHKQIAAQAVKAKKLGRATMIAGAAAGRFSTVGAGIAASRTEMYSEFARTKSVRAFPPFRLIKVNGRFSHNQVYAAKEDFAFVKQYVLDHCPGLKRKKPDGGK